MLAQVLADADAVLSHPLTVTIGSGVVVASLLWIGRVASSIPTQIVRLEERVISVGQKLVDHMAEEERQRADEVDRIARIEDKLDRTLSMTATSQRRDEAHDRAEA
jgi:hypothetical protein